MMARKKRTTRRRSDSTPLEPASFTLPKTVREWLAWRAERNGISRSRLVTLTLERAMRPGVEGAMKTAHLVPQLR